MPKKIVKTPRAPEAIGPYSQGVVVEPGRLLFTAGQIALDPKSGYLIEGDIEIQTAKVLENLKAICEAAGTGMDRVVKTTVFLKSIGDFPKMNRVYETFFGENPPARSAFEVAALPKNALVEIECVAWVGP